MEVCMRTSIVLGFVFALISFNSYGYEFRDLPYKQLTAPIMGLPSGNTFATPYLFQRNATQWLGKAYIKFLAPDNKGAEMCSNKKYPTHLGSDFAAPDGTPVYAIDDGTVVRVGGFTGVGDKYVVVESGSTDKWTTVYGHLKNIPYADTKNGKTVIKKGALIGYVYPYRSLGDIPHLHLGIRKGAYAGKSIDESTFGFIPCGSNDSYNFINPESLYFYTNYYPYHSSIIVK